MSSAFAIRKPPDRLDWQAVRARVDLATVAAEWLGPPQQRRGDGRGRRLWWTCPFHADSNPSFCIEPGKPSWKCWGCGEKGDAATLVMKLDGATFPEAVRRLAETCGVDAEAAPRPGPTKPVATPPRPVERPSGLPATDALRLVEDAAARIWTAEGREGLGHLRSRGLDDVTIRAARLGFVDRVAIPTKDSDRRYVVSGVVIPWFDGDRLALVKVRQMGDAKPKYAEAFRNRPRIFPSLAYVRPGRPVVIVEGELDALVLRQAIGDHAAVVTTGSASAAPAPDVLWALGVATPWFSAHDADAAGDRAAGAWPARAIRVRPPDPFNDWTDAARAGVDLRCWWLPTLGGREALWAELSAWRWGPSAECVEPPDDPETTPEQVAWLDEFNRLIRRAASDPEAS